MEVINPSGDDLIHSQGLALNKKTRNGFMHNSETATTKDVAPDKIVVQEMTREDVQRWRSDKVNLNLY